MLRLASAFVVGLLMVSVGWAAEDEPKPNPARVTEPGKLPDDARLGKLRNLYDEYHPWVPPANKEAWEREAKSIRERILVSNGLWPMPPKLPLNAVIHGRVDKGDYTVEKVYFTSLPGHYVTGSLYRPKGEGKHAGVLCPHGHWQNGRFYDASEAKAEDYKPEAQIKQGAEKQQSGARFPLQARMVGLARTGCVVFHYDMVGYADSKGIAHREGLTDAEAELRLQNHMGLQTWNSLRALDFLTSLEDVDTGRIGVTGASGGGTQTFMLCALDPRVTAAFPAVMVSTAMQGGCVCENADFLRIGINNIALTALFAPKPLAMSGADDWTINIETRGLPELKQIYSFYGKTDLVAAQTFKQFKHNYNQVAREMMYDWFNEHLKLGQKGPVEEREFDPILPAELTVWDDKHPVPTDVANPAKLRDYLTTTAKDQFAELAPKTPEKLAEYKRVIGTAARILLDDGVPPADKLETSLTSSDFDGVTLTKGTIGRKDAGEKVPFLALVPKSASGTVVLRVEPKDGIAAFVANGKPEAESRRLLDAGHIVAGVDVFLTGEYVEAGKEPAYPKLEKGYGGYTFGYNRPVISNRVRDILTAVAAAKKLPGAKRVVLVADGEAAPWGLLARAIAGSEIDDAVIKANDFDFSSTMPSDNPNFLPGALKYGGLYGLAAAAAPAKLLVLGGSAVKPEGRALLEAAYAHSPGALTITDRITPKEIYERFAPAASTSRLDKKIEIDFRRTPLQEACAYIAENTSVNIRVDGDGLKSMGYTKNMSQTFKLGLLSGKRGLREITDRYNGLCLVAGDKADEYLLTTKQAAERLKKTPLDLAD